ncbi:MAG: HAMP domain-containing histidine kinase [Lachnospiraceae bacterium]|nr:HAMP domain-containing histidine kinase [Lachnospiraceae bacterium]
MLYIIIGILSVTLILCICKIYLLKKSAGEIRKDFAEKVSMDTNTQITISSADKDMQSLVNDLNKQLERLRNEYLKYNQGNTELKRAITNIAHDLRTPLTALYGYIDLLKNSDDPEKKAQYLSIMKERAEIMKQLVEELFRYSLVVSDEKELNIEKIFINKLLEESIGSFYPALNEKRIEPDINITSKHIYWNADKQALERVFSNLLNNVIKYSDGDLIICLSEDGVLKFSNTARNLTTIKVEQLFDRFYTVNDAKNSTGLGLSIARALVEKMGGTISAEYKNEMLTLSIYIP